MISHAARLGIRWLGLVLAVSACSPDKDEGTTIRVGGSGGTGAGTDGGSAASASGGMGLGFGLGGESSSGGSDFGADGGETCASKNETAVQTPTQVLFVLDRSGSMNCNPPDGDAAVAAACATNPAKTDPSAPSKWEVTRDALQDALATLGDTPNVSAGLSLFPRRDGQLKCQVPTEPDVAIAPLSQTLRDAVDAHLRSPEADPPLGDTPIAGSVLLSYEYLRQRLVSGAFEGNSFVVLLTDGAETCATAEYDRLVGSEVDLATAFGIRTFVIGAPGSEGARATLSEIAFVGQTSGPTCGHGGADPSVGDCHFDMTTSTDFASALGDALAQISQAASLTCEFDVPESTSTRPVDLDKVNVTFTPSSGDAEAIGKLDLRACDAGESGWRYDADFTKILLCGDVCERAKADTTGDVVIELGCKTREILR